MSEISAHSGNNRTVTRGKRVLRPSKADGSRKLPFKAPQAGEPVLPVGGLLEPPGMTVVAVAGVDALGRPIAEDFVCRCATADTNSTSSMSVRRRC